MRQRLRSIGAAFLACVVCGAAAPARAGEQDLRLAQAAPAASDAGSELRQRWSGRVVGRHQWHTQSAAFPDQPDTQQAVIAEVEYYVENDSGTAFSIKPYLRQELHDGGDGFADLREALLLTYGEDWELRAGVGKVFWGVTESVHLVDIVNQTDFQDDLDGEEKLGQPMLQGTLLRDWGTLDLFLLPGFRPRELPRLGDRPRFPLPVDNDAATYESGDEARHVDFAARWNRTFDLTDLALSYFNGTSREPRLIAGSGVLVPFYPQIEQLGLEFQLTTEGWLWKLEAIHREDDRESYNAAAGGFEYTIVGVFDSDADLGIIGEYLYDERGARADDAFQDDVLVGLRLALNDVQSSEALLGVIQDLDGGGRALNLEASRRVGESFKLDLEVRGFYAAEDDPRLQGFARDDLVRIELGYYF